MTEQKSDHNQDNQVKPQKKKTLGKIVIAIALVFFLPILASALLLASSSLQREAIKVVDRMLDSINIEQVEGGLQEGLLLTGLHYQAQGVDVLVPKTKLRVDLHCLWRFDLCIKNIQVEGPNIHIDTAQMPPSSSKQSDNKPLQAVTLPISVQLDLIEVQNLALNIDKHRVDLAKFESALSLNNQRGLTLFPTKIDGLTLNLDKPTEQDLLGNQLIHKKQLESSSQPQKQEIDWDKLEQDLAPALLANLERIELPFAFHIQEIKGSNWQLSQTQAKFAENVYVPNLLFSLDSQGDKVSLKQFLIESSLGTMQSFGSIELNNAFPIDFNLDVQLNDIKQAQQLILPKSQLQLQIKGNLKEKTGIHLDVTGITEATLEAEAYLNQEKTPFKVQLDTKNFAYPFDAKAGDAIQLPYMNFLLQGNLFDYRLNLTTALEGKGLPKSKVDLQVKGQLQEAEIEHFQLNTLQGQATMQGKIGWRNKLQWYQHLNLKDLVLSQYLSNIPSRLSGELFTTGLLDKEQWLIDIPELNLQGSLSNKPLDLQGQLSLGSETHFDQLLVKVPKLDLNYGKNHIKALGRIGEKSDFQLVVNAPELSGIVPHFKAAIQGAINLKGNISAPNLSIEANGQGIQYQQLRLNKFRALGKVDVANLSTGKLDVQLDGLSQKNIKFNQIKLSLLGNEPQHQLQLNIQGSPIAGKLQLSGSFDRQQQRWQGTLSQLQIQSPVGKIQPNRNIQINYDHQAIQGEISQHCWLNPYAELCFVGLSSLGKTGNIAFNLKSFNLDLINELLGQDSLKGRLQSEGQISWLAGESPLVKFALKGDNLSVAHKIDYRTFKLALPKLTMNLDIANNNLAMKSELQVENQGKLIASLAINDLSAQKSLNGSLQIQQLNLSLLNQLLTENEQVKGNLNGNLKFTGKVDTSNIVGDLSVKNISAVMKDLPFDVEQGQLDLRFKGNNSLLEGYIKTPDSQLNIKGDASWQNIDKWNSRLSLQAKQFKVDIPNMAKLKVSPNIEIKANPTLLQLTGEIDVPWARVEIETLPESAVSVSKDEVILDGKEQKKLLKKLPAKTKSSMNIVSNLTINIHDDVRLDAYGLKTNLRGLLNIRQESGDLGLFGQINLLRGKYASFGQDLLIRKGMISFSSMPSQPMLEIEAIRNPESMESSGVVAGIRVIGLADNPTIKLFSEPSMSQDQVLSYVLTGRSLERSGESGGSISAALLGLGLAKSGKLVGGIGQAFGIQDLNLGAQGIGEQSKVVVSGSITPRLHIKYSVGLFDGLAEFTVRYRLLPKFYVQSVSGITQAVDLLYQFEF